VGVIDQINSVGKPAFYNGSFKTARLFRSPRADSIRARERALRNRPDIWLQSRSKQKSLRHRLANGGGVHICENSSPLRLLRKTGWLRSTVGSKEQGAV